MAEGGYPNTNRATNAYNAYGDAMRPYVARVLEGAHGPDWIRLRLLSDDLRENNRRRYDEIRQALQSKKPPEEIFDRADIPSLVNGDRENFSDLNRDEVRNLFTIRGLRNAIVHSGRGDCTVEEANAIIGLCVLTLERCGLFEAAENIRSLSLEGAAEASDAELREQRERRDWDKTRLAGKSLEELTPWEQQRLAEIEWEEEWERRELVRREREREAAERERREREQHERERREREQRERARREREQREREQRQGEREQERREREQREREQRQGEREQARRQRIERESFEIAAFGDDLEGLRRWFNAVGDRRKLHPSEYTALKEGEREHREQKGESKQRKHERSEHERRQGEREQARRRRIEREQIEIAAFDDDIEGLRRWFNAVGDRRKLHPSEYTALKKGEREHRG